eukprot:3565194-Pleurochrysis_carterae.AAC.3
MTTISTIGAIRQEQISVKMKINWKKTGCGCATGSLRSKSALKRANTRNQSLVIVLIFVARWAGQGHAQVRRQIVDQQRTPGETRRASHLPLHTVIRMPARFPCSAAAHLAETRELLADGSRGELVEALAQRAHVDLELERAVEVDPLMHECRLEPFGALSNEQLEERLDVVRAERVAQRAQHSAQLGQQRTYK